MTLKAQALSGAQVGVEHARRALPACVDAYASGRPKLGEQLFPAALAQVQDIIRKVVVSTVDERLHEDAEQAAALLVWRSVSRGITPNVKLLTYHAALGEYRTATGMGDARSMSAAEYANASNRVECGSDVPTRSSDDDTEHAIGRADTDAVVDELAADNPIRGFVARGLSLGFNQAEIADAMGVNRSTVCRIVASIREQIGGAD